MRRPVRVRRALLAGLAALGVTLPTIAAAAQEPTRPPEPVVPPGVVLAPAGADEAGRRQALAELRAGERDLRTATTTHRNLTKRLAPLQQARDDANARIAALAATEGAAATDLATAREGVRRLAIAGYVVGGDVPPVDYLLRAQDPADLFRRHSLVKSATESKAETLDAYEAAKSAASVELHDTMAAADAAAAELRQVESEVAVAATDMAKRKVDVDNRRKLLDVITAAAPVAPSDIPRLFLDAYRKAAATTAKRSPACRVGWTALAGIGRIEANHGRYRGARLALNGDVYPHIVGIPLDGTSGTRTIKDTDKGKLDGDPVFDHAVGPMQFIPSTWARVAQDGNGDGTKDPNNAYDATLTAAVYLCRAVPSGGLDSEEPLRRAFYSYNHSAAYVDTAITSTRAYDAVAGSL